MHDKTTINVLHETIKEPTPTCKFFHDAVYGTTSLPFGDTMKKIHSQKKNRSRRTNLVEILD